MASPIRKIVIGARPSNGSSLYALQWQEERARQDAISRLLVRWERGFSIEDAPPDRNEWTRTPAPCSNGPR